MHLAVLFSLPTVQPGGREKQAHSAHQAGSVPAPSVDLPECKWSCQLVQASLSRAVSSVSVGSSSLYHIEAMHWCLPIDNTLPEACYFLICLLVAVKTGIH